MRNLPILLLALFPLWAHGEPLPDPLSVEEAIKAMDKDHDGQVTVSEMRAYLEARHGKGYQQALLEEMEIKAGLRSCGSPFTRSLY